ncbi:hypothetical protein F2Q70_00017893 [Brassica cretica]|uniref:Zinc finger PMZ-type domain-containing protein n=1 Tax=Brassica cretica TaxID=69181 RepID=A0A8S9I1H1_BRACR|nr:hypothetical protein F2Q70_00017893 [Brassica cretica]KAF2598013.1 hypothetical protein F2Q68_00010870 [Brassica cretica]
MAFSSGENAGGFGVSSSPSPIVVWYPSSSQSAPPHLGASPRPSFFVLLCRHLWAPDPAKRKLRSSPMVEFYIVSRQDYRKALSPLDGRYWGKVKDLASSMSEFGLIYFRVLVEIKWLIKLSKIPEVTEVPSFSKDAEVYLQGIIDGFSMDDALEVKKIERVLEFFHFACTSEDINHLSHGLMLREAFTSVILPAMDDLIKKWRFEERRYLSETKIKGKFAGAAGNYNAHMSAYPNIDWPHVAEEFVTSLGLTFNPYVTQDCVVDLEHQKCDCDVYAVEKIPFSHAIAAGSYAGLNISILVCPVYSKDTLFVGYSENINPCVGKQVEAHTCFPPEVKRGPRRQKKSRWQSWLKLSRMRGRTPRKQHMVYKCSICKETGHTSPQCKN